MMSYGYPDGMTQADHDRAFDDLGPAPDEDAAYDEWRDACHRHTCLCCGRVIAEGEFDCERDEDHDFGLCDSCVKEQKSVWS